MLLLLFKTTFFFHLFDKSWFSNSFFFSQHETECVCTHAYVCVRTCVGTHIRTHVRTHVRTVRTHNTHSVRTVRTHSTYVRTHAYVHCA